MVWTNSQASAGGWVHSQQGGASSLPLHASRHEYGGDDEVSLDRGDVVLVAQLSELPDPVDGVITLLSLTYKSMGSVDITPNVMVGSGGTVLTGENRNHCQIITDTTTNPDPSLPLIGAGIIEIDCVTLVNTGGRCIDQTVPPGTVFNLRDSYFANGTQDRLTDGTGSAAVVIDGCQWQPVFVGGVPVPAESGIELVGPFAVVGMQDTGGGFLAQASGSLFDMTSATIIADQVKVVGCLILPSASQTAMQVTETSPPTEGGVFRDCGFGEVGVGLLGVEPGTPGWDTDIPGKRKSALVGDAFFEANTLATTFTDTTTYKRIATTPPWVEGGSNERVELPVTPGDRLRITSRVDAKLKIAVGVVVEGTNPNNVFIFRVQRERDAVLATVGTFRADYRTSPKSKNWGFTVDVEGADDPIFTEYWLEWRNSTAAANGTVIDAFMSVTGV